MSLCFGRFLPSWNEKKKNWEITAMQEGVTTRKLQKHITSCLRYLGDEKPVSNFPLIVGVCDKGSKKQGTRETM